MIAKPAALAFPLRRRPTVDEDPPPVQSGPRKPVQNSVDIRGNRPVPFMLQQSAGRLFREWKNGKRIREMARNYGTRVDAMEDLIREAA